MLLKAVALRTTHLSALYDFYSGILGLPVSRRGAEKIIIAAGQTELSFESTATSTAVATNPFYHFAFNIPSGKIEEASQWLSGKVVLLWMEEYESYIAEFTTWHARSVYFFDPAGNIVEFIERVDLHDNSPEPFSSTQIRNVSEIGIVFPAAGCEEQVNELLQKFQLKYFSKQSPMKHFRAIGDDEGLFIVVPAQRNWYPTNVAGDIFPLSLKLINNGHEHELRV
jgi:catechol-2,3-dioxygenase